MTVGAGTTMQTVAALVIAVSWGACSTSNAANKDMQIWFGPKTFGIKPSGSGLDYTMHDFPAFIAPGAPWVRAESRVSVISLPGNVVWSYPDRQSLVEFFNRTKLKLALGSGMLFNGGKCGVGVEGMSKDPDQNRETAKVVQLWKLAGGRLDYIVMDSPYYFGHLYNGGCHYSITEVAREVAATLHLVFRYYPDLKIVDAEGPGFTPNDMWVAGMGEFLRDFRAAAGRTISAVALDLHWKDLRAHETWVNTARQGVAFFHSHGVQVGLFIDADGTRRNLASDAAWMDDNRRHLTQVAQAHLNLDFVSIESWVGVPAFNLPEESPIAFTSLINTAYKAFKTN